MKLLASIATLWLLLLNVPTPSVAAVRYGVVVPESGGAACLTMLGEDLPEGTSLLVVFDDPQTVVEAVVGAVVDSACSPGSPREGTSYALALGGSLDVTAGVGIAVLSPGAQIRLEGGSVSIRTRGVRTPLTFATCTSTEGIHLTAWRGARRVWHQYYYLGYDVEPNCTEKEAH